MTDAIPPATLRLLSDLTPWSQNYNRGDVDAIRRSISRFGFNGRLAIWKDDVIVAGNHAWKVLAAMHADGEPPPTHVEATAAGWLVPIVDVTHLPTREEAYAYAIADNRTRDLAETDAEILAGLLQEIAEADEALVEATGHDAEDLARLLSELAEDDPLDGVDLSDRYTEQYGVVIVCESESEQASVYERMVAEGFTCKVVVT